LAAQAGNGLACIIYLNGRLIRRKPQKPCQMAVIQRNAKKPLLIIGKLRAIIAQLSPLSQPWHDMPGLVAGGLQLNCGKTNR
jgi:hypothetical protein